MCAFVPIAYGAFEVVGAATVRYRARDGRSGRCDIVVFKALRNLLQVLITNFTMRHGQFPVLGNGAQTGPH